MLDYFRRLSTPALAATLEYLGWERRGADWVKLGLAGVALMIAGVLGASALALGQWFLGTVLLIVFIFALPLLFLWNVFVAAYVLDENLHAALDAARQPSRHFDELVAKKLYDLLVQGNQLLDCRKVPEKRPPDNVWAEDLVAWCVHAQELVTRNLPRSDAMGFSTISVLPSADHSQTDLEKILRARQDCLRRIASRYMEFAPGQ
jgi:hypothetical protein